MQGCETTAAAAAEWANGYRFTLHREWPGVLCISLDDKYSGSYTLPADRDRSASFPLFFRVATYVAFHRSFPATVDVLMASAPESVFSQILNLYVTYLLTDEEQDT